MQGYRSARAGPFLLNDNRLCCDAHLLLCRDDHDQVGSLRLTCAEVVLEQHRTAAELQQRLFCGYHQAASRPVCAAAAGTVHATAHEAVAAIDWRRTDTTLRFEPDLYVNDTYGLSSGHDGSVAYQRSSPALLNMAVNAWLATVLGARRALVASAAPT
jgi:hypothetical protein